VHAGQRRDPIAEIVLQKDLKPPYDWDEFAQCFLPKAEELVSAAEAAEKEGNNEQAAEFYMFVKLRPKTLLARKS
jgi:hypothetical protein